jgi:phosphoglycolate phosphatase-like HAD superfamily hydrolase
MNSVGTSSFRYDAIVFDFDGTIVQSNEIKTKAFRKLYEKYGGDIVKQVAEHHEQNIGISRYEKFRYFHENLLHLHYTHNVEEKLAKRFSQLIFDSIVQVPYVEGALEFIERFHLKLNLFVASGTPEKELQKIIELRKMSKYFSGIFGTPRNKTEILKNIIRVNCFIPERVLMVGDAHADWEGAQSAGTDFIGIQKQNELSHFPESSVVMENLISLKKYVTH